MPGAERVIAIDRFAYRLAMAREKGGAETLNYEEVDVLDALKEMTGDRGPDATIKTGQTHVQNYTQPLLEKIQAGFDPSYIITHHLKLEDAPKGYDLFKNKLDNCTKVVLHPGG